MLVVNQREEPNLKVGGATVKEVCEKVKVAHDACQEEQQINNNNNNNNNNASS